MPGSKTSNGLGIFSRNQKIFLFYRDPDSKKDFFRVDLSSDGLHFKSHNNQAEILKRNGKREKIGTCRNFRISKFKNIYFLTYNLQIKKRTLLCGALSDDLIHWKKLGKISSFGQTGALISNYKYKDKYVLYFGKKSIKIALSKNLKTWKVSKKPVFQLSKKLVDKYSIKIASLIENEKGMLLIYFLDSSLRALLFDKNNPRKHLWKSDRVIWQRTSEWANQEINLIGTTILDDQLISYWQSDSGKLFALSHPHFKSILKSPKSSFTFSVLKRFKRNPILRPIAKHFWESKFVFNPAALYEDGKVHLVYRAIGENDVSVFGYASSKDGISIDKRLKDPIYVPKLPFESNPQAPLVFSTYASGGGCGGCEDPRLTKIKDRIYMTYIAFDGRELPKVALTSIKVDDFLDKKWNWEQPVLISPPGEIHKNWVIFPEKINGKYAILHSISPTISIAYVDNLKFDDGRYINSYYNGDSQRNYWDSWVRGTGPPPIKTKDGWLILYHAMDKQNPSRYKVGAMILDHENPTKILYRSCQPILEPDERYENEGFKAGVVYTCGAVIMSNRLFVYYGGADTVTCAASVNLNKFLNQLKYSGSARLEPIIND